MRRREGFRLRQRALSCVVLLATACVTPLPLREQVRFREVSAFQTVVVVDDAELRCMRFGEGPGALNQSCRRHDRPDQLAFEYTRAMTAVLLAWQPAPKRVLLIGVGGGSVPMALRRLRPDMHIDAVDIDPVVLKAAQRWFGLRADAAMHLHAADGLVFVERARSSGLRYDAVLLDAFDAEGIPASLFSDAFLRSLRALLTADGVFVANTFATAPSAERETMAALAVFDRLYDLRTGDGAGNRLLLAAGRPEHLPARQRLWQALPLRREALSRVGIEATWVEALHVLEHAREPGAR